MSFPKYRTTDKNLAAMQNDGRAETIIEIQQEINNNYGEAFTPEHPFVDGSFLIKRPKEDGDYLLLEVRPTDWVVRVAKGKFIVVLADDFWEMFSSGGHW